MKGITPNEFFNQVCLNSGIADLRTVKDVYFGLLKTVSKEVRSKHVVFLPDWGEFALKIHKSRKSVDVNDGIVRVLPAKPTLKFYPCKGIKKYFQSLAEAGL